MPAGSVKRLEIGVRPQAGPSIAIAVLVLTFLGACGGEEERALTARQYADAMEDAHAALQEDSGNLEADLERAFEDSFEDMGDWLASLGEDSWSDEDAELASEFAETLVRAFTDVFEGMFGVLGDYGDEISSLRPPAHLAELHNTLTEGIEEFVREGRELVEDLKDIDTDIDSEEELGDFWASLGSIGDSDLGPGEQVEEACRELRAKLEAELGTNVNICE